MAGQLEGKVALVTGGSAGIGRATALTFGREGAKVVVADVNAEGGEETAATIKENGGESTFVHANVSRAADVEAMIQRVLRSRCRPPTRVAYCNVAITSRTATASLNGVASRPPAPKATPWIGTLAPMANSTNLRRRLNMERNLPKTLPEHRSATWGFH